MSQRKIEINWQPKRNINTSLSNQIISYVKKQVFKGDWLCGDLLPSQRVLAESFGVNRSTIVEALGELKALGIVESHVGKGTVIVNNSWSMLFADATPDWQTYITSGIHKSNTPTIQLINKHEFYDETLRLSTGEISSELMPHDAISQVLNKMAKEQIPYSYLEPLGLYELRLELCKYLTRYNIHVKPSEILIVSGSLQALQLISLSLLGQASTVLVEENSYVNSLKVFDFEGIKKKTVPTDLEGVIPWLINENNVTDKTLLYTIPTFHNPTGLTMGQNRRVEVLEWCKSHQLPIIEDDAYRELYFDHQPPDPIKAMDDSGNILYLGSISKSLAPGLRLGWVIGPESIIERLGDIKMQSDYGASSVSQWLLTYLIRDGHYEEHLKQLRVNLKSRRDEMLSYLEDYFSDLGEWRIPEGGFYIWLNLKAPISPEKLFDLALKEKLLINPGYVYGLKKNTYIRLSFCYTPSKDLKLGLKRLATIISEHK